MGWFRSMLAFSAVVLLAAGCQPNNRQGPGRVTMNSSATTRPSSAGGGGPGGAGGAPGQRVELMVRDANAAGMAGSVVGRNCRLQFRRDALGIASNAAIGPTQDWGGRMSIEGKVLDLTDQWIVIAAAQNKRYCVPLMSVLMVEVQE